MIEICNITKNYDDICVLNRFNASFAENSLGMIHGTSGSGRSTLIRIIGGIVRPDEGVVIVDNMPIFDNTTTKKRMALVTDNMSYPLFMNIKTASARLSRSYDGADPVAANELCERFGINSKKMFMRMTPDEKAIAKIIIALSTRAKYLICDDIFGNLREETLETVSGLVEYALDEMHMTPVIAVSDPALLKCGAGQIYELKPDI